MLEYEGWDCLPAGTTQREVKKRKSTIPGPVKIVADGSVYKRFDSKLQTGPSTTDNGCDADARGSGLDGGSDLGDSGKLGGAADGREGVAFGSVSMVLLVKPRLHLGEFVERQWKLGRHACDKMIALRL